MRLAVIPIGNSKGIRIPKAILDKYQIKDLVEMELREDSIAIKPIPIAQEGWDEQFQKAIEEGHLSESESEMLGGFSNEFDETEWTW